MATITIRIDDETRDELEELAKAKDTTVSTLLRSQIDVLLGRDVEMSRRDVPHSLSMVQRLLLAQQTEILSLLRAGDDYDAERCRNQTEALNEGYTGEYDRVFAPVESELTRAECALVWDVLDMFRVVGGSVDKLNPADRAAIGENLLDRLRFDGFDLNDSLEGRLLHYVRYLIRTDRWTEIKDRLVEIGDDGNSHSPRLATYQRMLAAYQPILKARTTERGYEVDAYRLNVQQLTAVAEA